MENSKVKQHFSDFKLDEVERDMLNDILSTYLLLKFQTCGDRVTDDEELADIKALVEKFKGKDVILC